ncbi:GAF domain-containing protein [Chondromyces apiculatus]|uniref:Phytochrome, two-component sensor histidine kinase n=1 Tax=Chondromyces apiculatus DSM 436 TaxID=1192034 RepID=A0A017THB7_9BACT|nr:GAF domain-containing protein [Chondromyces apiculatus]EYF08317.1 Phytochrome, two-component sensor histidine kinase [Chondromyces apiculatus DSM 436]
MPAPPPGASPDASSDVSPGASASASPRVDLPVDAASTIDISACEREAIHLIPHIQPHGVLLALDPGNFAVLQVSASVEAHFGLPPARLLREGLAALLDASALGRLRERLASRAPADTHVHALLTIAGGGPYDILCHPSGDVLVLEIEPFTPAGRRPPDFYPLLRRALPQLRDEPSLPSFCQRVVEEIRALSRHDRVLLYRFLEDGSGEVLAEARIPEMPTYLGQRFPASDVPRQARALYARSPVRLIVDGRYAPSPLVPERDPRTGEFLDLSYAHLRGVSALHVEYLANMDVRGSMSLAIVRGDTLWGLIACHHRAPWALPYETRAACSFVASMVSSQITEQESRDDAEERARMHAAHAALIPRFTPEGRLPTLDPGEPDPTALLPCGGVAVICGDVCQRFGDTPEEPEIRALARFIAAEPRPDPANASGIAAFYATHALSAVWPPAASLQHVAAGVLAILLDDTADHCVLWFRPELVQTISWAGDPSALAKRSPDGVRISPRQSFDMWKQTVRGQSAPFRQVDIDAARGLRRALYRG